MLKIVDRQQNRLCDGSSRRRFLQVGALGLGFGGLGLTDVLRMEAQAGIAFNAEMTKDAYSFLPSWVHSR